MAVPRLMAVPGLMAVPQSTKYFSVESFDTTAMPTTVPSDDDAESKFFSFRLATKLNFKTNSIIGAQW